MDDKTAQDPGVVPEPTPEFPKIDEVESAAPQQSVQTPTQQVEPATPQPIQSPPQENPPIKTDAPPPPKPVKSKSKKGLIAILVILLLFLFAGIAYLFNQNTQLEDKLAKTKTVVPTPVPTTSPTETVFLGDSCGTENEKTAFSITLPPEWNGTDFGGSNIDYSYMLTGPEGYIKITCGIGFGGACPEENASTVSVGGQETQACIFESTSSQEISLSQASLATSTNSFVFSANTNNKDLLNQILSTFGFVDPSTEYTCPATEYVDCQPVVGNPELRQECTPEYLQWATQTCPGFKGAAL